jgi:hypothetical protein
MIYIVEHLITKERRELTCTWPLETGRLYEFLPLAGWWRVIENK